MKQLFLNGDATTLFFDDKVSLENITDWINKQIMSDLDVSLFNLNEEYSCLAARYRDMIIISGDEDYVEITIEQIIPINFK